MPAAAAPGTVLDATASAVGEPGVSAAERVISGWARWLLPNLCAAVFAVTLWQVLFFAGGHSLYRDSDTGWHILAGESMIANAQVPTTDPYSFTRAGRPWLAWEWLSDVAFGAAHRAAGLRGVELLSALAIALAVTGSVALALRLGANFFAAAGGAALLLVVTSVHWLARPHIFGWLFALAFLAVAELHRPGKKMLWTLPVLSVLWVNMHGSFVLGPALLLIYAVGRAARFRDYSLAALLSLLASFVNPYGWHLHQHVFAYLRDGYIMDHIGEFRSFDFHADGAIGMELFLLIAVIGGLLAARRKDWPVVLLSLVLLHQGLFAARHLPLAALLLVPFALRRLSWEAAYVGVSAELLRTCEEIDPGGIAACSRWSSVVCDTTGNSNETTPYPGRGTSVFGRALGPLLGSWGRTLLTGGVAKPARPPATSGDPSGINFSQFLAYSERLRAIDRRIVGAVPAMAAVFLAVLAIAPAAAEERGFDPQTFPLHAAGFFEDQNSARVFATRFFTTDQWGGYLIYRFDGQMKVFIDGRSDFYGEDFLRRYGTVRDVRPGWDRILDTEHVTHVMIGPQEALAQALRLSPQWHVVRADHVAMIFERRTP
jgi:hypothetical protein